MVLMISWWLFTFILFFISGNICERVYMSSLFVLKVYMICAGYYTHNYVLLRKYIYQLIIRYVLMKNTYIKWYYSIINLFLSLPGLKLYRRLQLEWIYIYIQKYFTDIYFLSYWSYNYISVFLMKWKCTRRTRSGADIDQRVAELQASKIRVATTALSLRNFEHFRGSFEIYHLRMHNDKCQPWYYKASFPRAAYFAGKRGHPKIGNTASMFDKERERERLYDPNDGKRE